MARYRAGVIGLGWMGMLYDVGERMGTWNVDDIDRPTPELDLNRKFYHHEHPGKEGLPSSYSEALSDRPEVELVAGSDRDRNRLKAFSHRYGCDALYNDAAEMLEKEQLDIVAITTNTKGRSHFTCLAVENGAKAIFTEKPMAHTLEEADRMVKMCAKAGVPLNGGAISTTHPSFGKAKELITSGAIGKIVSIESSGPTAQHQNWTYFLDSAPAWVIGVGDGPRRESGSSEFGGQGMMVTVDELVVHFRRGAPAVRINGTAGEITFDGRGWRLLQQLENTPAHQFVEMPWPDPQFVPPYGAVYALADLIDCLKGKLDEPKNSGRRVAIALEVEIALKQSSANEAIRIDLPLKDRSLGLHYDWFR